MLGSPCLFAAIEILLRYISELSERQDCTLRYPATIQERAHPGIGVEQTGTESHIELDSLYCFL
jgi:hypothetical protein